MEHGAIFQVPAIDIHSHLGPVHGPMALDCIEDGSIEYLLRTMEQARIEISVNSSRYAIMPKGSGYAAEGNRQLMEAVEANPSIYGWVTVDPHQRETLEQAERWVSHPKILGLKIHPELHEYQLEDEGAALFSFAQSLGAPVLGHSGGPRCMPEVYGRFARQYPDVFVIAAHLGSSPDGDPTHYLRAIEECPTDNLYTDTSSSMSVFSRLLEYAVERIGSSHILFGTDSSNYFSPCQRIRIDAAEISEGDKERILRGNALSLFPKLAGKML